MLNFEIKRFVLITHNNSWCIEGEPVAVDRT